MNKGNRAFVVLASQIFENAWNSNNTMILSYPDKLGNVHCYDLDMGNIVRTNVEGIKFAKKVREVEERDWGWNAVIEASGVQADEDLRYELGDYLKWD